MTTFVAVKIHYDHRKDLPIHLKYSRIPNPEEYRHYTDLYNEGVGGNGFHECMNFAIGRDTVDFYLSPTCVPGNNRQLDQNGNPEEFVFFTFTYQQGPILPSHIIGVHAGARLLPRTARLGSEFDEINRNFERLYYNAQAPSDLVTLFTPIPYDHEEGRHTRRYRVWGNGRRYIERNHASNILNDAIQKTEYALRNRGNESRTQIDNQLNTLKKIKSSYGL